MSNLVEKFPAVLEILPQVLRGLGGFFFDSHCICLIQLCGPALDETRFRSSVDVIFEGLRQAIVDAGTGRLVYCPHHGFMSPLKFIHFVQRRCYCCESRRSGRWSQNLVQPQ